MLLPDSVTARFASADRPLFTKRIKAKCPDCTVLYQNAGGDASKQQQQAQAMLTQGVNVLVLDAFDGEAAASIVTLAKAKNVPVISYDRLINSDGLSAYISFDNQKVGQLQATALTERLKQLGVADDAGILEINGSPTDNNAGQFKSGAQSVLSKSSYKVLGEYDTPGWDPAKAQSWAAGQISKVGVTNVKGIYAANDDTAGGVIAAMRAAGATTIPPITGQDATLAGLQRILQGSQYMTVYKAFKPEAQGAADLALQLAAGKKPTTNATVKTAGGASVPSVILTPVAVTADQIQGTVVKDGLFTASQICTSALQAACTKYGIK
ncbi:substrate-binding domain-containing protein [Frondihabitans sp. PhB188]|uniref:substrate-binding domain-containing protein n=1 Tax=Frondihabitans sp. PhB188 TaxID=2485200 RepID=UPI001F297F79|nr:substrate-binding domain-containing protein [Frondihabitans sp. PhB188]